MRCPICGGLYIYVLDDVFTCTSGHHWAWTERGLVVRMPPPNRWINITIVRTAPEQEISTWEGEGGR